MRMQQFFTWHNIKENPFACAEEAQGDDVLIRILERNQFNFSHPGWDKFCGTPAGKQTSFVFGPKGSGKTAMRLSLEKCIEQHNRTSPDDKVLLVRYSEFNPYLERWKMRTETKNSSKRSSWDRLRGKPLPPASLHDHWTLSHHIDAILSEVATLIPDILLDGGRSPKSWPAIVKHDVVFMAATYLPLASARYRGTIRKIVAAMYPPWRRGMQTLAKWCAAIGTLMVAPCVAYIRSRSYAQRANQRIDPVGRDTKDTAWAYRIVPANHLRAIPLLSQEGSAEATETEHETRYELLGRLTSIVSTAGYARTVVVVDKVDEPTLINGDARRMGQFIRPLINNKLAQLKNLHFKMLLPNQLNVLRRKANVQEANDVRLDKANVIDPFIWSGVDLYEMLGERVSACSNGGLDDAQLQGLFSEDVTKDIVVAQLERLKTPRYANKFMERLIRETCSGLLDQEGATAPAIPAQVFFRVSAEMESQIRTDAQDLDEHL